MLTTNLIKPRVVHMILHRSSKDIIKLSNFTGLRNLDSLGLAHNQLKEVPANVFSHISLLNSLELDGNQIVRIDENAFAGLEGKHIALSRQVNLTFNIYKTQHFHIVSVNFFNLNATLID